MKYILPLSLIFAGCGPIPVQVQSSKQEQSQRQSVKQEVANDLAADQQSSHQSESKQGTNSMPVIILCVSNNSPSSQCATPKEGGAITESIDKHILGTKK